MKDELARIWVAAGGDRAALERVALTGTDPLLPTAFEIGTAASAVIAATALAATELWRLRTGCGQSVAVDMREAVAATPFGRLRHVRPAARLSETPAFWSRAAVPRGTHEPAWPSGA